MNLKDKHAVVTGGSRGLGLGVVEALVDQGAKVWVVAREEAALAEVRRRLGVETIAADITDAEAAGRILKGARPDILVLNAGAIPAGAPIDKVRWEDFSRPWDVDVKGGLIWLQAALNLPLQSGARVLVGSSGAAVLGSPLSGGYAGAKRMLWLMTKYAAGLSQQKGLGIRFQTVVPRQMVGGTGVGGAGATAYAAAKGVDQETILAGFGAPLPPRRYGDHIVEILTDAKWDEALALGVKGDDGVTLLEGAAA